MTEIKAVAQMHTYRQSVLRQPETIPRESAIEQ